MARRRGRGIKRKLLIGFAVLCWLGVRSSAGPAPERGPAVDASGPAVRGAAAAFEPGELRPPAARGEQTASLEREAPSVAPPDTRAALRDRLAGALRAMGSTDFASALQASREVGKLPLLDEERGELERVEGALELRLAGELERLLSSAANGEVLLAAVSLRGIAAADAERVTPLLDAAWRARQVELPGADVLEPLPRGTPLRWFDAAGLEQSGEAVDCRGEELSVRMRGERGFVFPTLRRVEVEPRAPRRALARAQCAAAQRGGDPLLARLWALRAAALAD
ncbi:MAG: hypothetical protein IT457_22260 [Planctomycetes bacterium]|nr:hypothetical protein [Planctomycetota bacterium]